MDLMNHIALTLITILFIRTICTKAVSDQCTDNILEECEDYHLTVNQPFGAIITNIDLAKCNLTKSLMEKIKSDIHRHELIIFKEQGQQNNFVIPAQKRVEIGKKLGRVVKLKPYASPSRIREILRVSNNEKYGKTKQGISGWHNDALHCYSIMHIISVPKRGFGQTKFISSNLALSNLNYNKELWDSLYVIQSDNFHRFIAKHPITDKKMILKHAGKNLRFAEISEKETLASEYNISFRYYSEEQKQTIMDEINLFFKNCELKDLVYSHEYEKGDLIITDNLAVLHMAHESTQFPTEQIGLRIMDRISISDTYKEDIATWPQN
eukprot:530693_1